ncbi:ribbon-helix-helix domain-containing protein [Aquibaculum arenosum]|uniref:Ribbon-helix-helix domain-containing protein n=1 Tax=Aquibaculum arenosum TaxID=3032591 RepID=A0ABT5YM15_9PROT|nr:ribbon-helix-helix domain-containing protein [Fodinicurvata sp. CAU 1616]MDF2095876.1 ribbon-helix-helix domain-containing protein [Fodinicurvata sp. CAU 1616]
MPTRALESRPLDGPVEASAPRSKRDAVDHGAQELRNIRVQERRTSLRLESPMWDALEEVCLREGVGMDRLISCIRATSEGNLASAVRTFLVTYYRAAATEQGHKAAGHGLFRDC